MVHRHPIAVSLFDRENTASDRLIKIHDMGQQYRGKERNSDGSIRNYDSILHASLETTCSLRQEFRDVDLRHQRDLRYRYSRLAVP